MIVSGTLGPRLTVGLPVNAAATISKILIQLVYGLMTIAGPTSAIRQLIQTALIPLYHTLFPINLVTFTRRQNDIRNAKPHTSESNDYGPGLLGD